MIAAAITIIAAPTARTAVADAAAIATEAAATTIIAAPTVTTAVADVATTATDADYLTY